MLVEAFSVASFFSVVTFVSITLSLAVSMFLAATFFFGHFLHLVMYMHSENKYAHMGKISVTLNGRISESPYH